MIMTMFCRIARASSESLWHGYNPTEFESDPLLIPLCKCGCKDIENCEVGSLYAYPESNCSYKEGVTIMLVKM